MQGYSCSIAYFFELPQHQCSTTAYGWFSSSLTMRSTLPTRTGQGRGRPSTSMSVVFLYKMSMLSFTGSMQNPTSPAYLETSARAPPRQMVESLVKEDPGKHNSAALSMPSSTAPTPELSAIAGPCWRSVWIFCRREMPDGRNNGFSQLISAVNWSTSAAASCPTTNLSLRAKEFAPVWKPFGHAG